MFSLKLHPTTLILAWIGFALVLAGLGLSALIAASALVAALMLISGVSRCWQLLRRTRILLLAMMLVYLFATPGSALLTGWDVAYPTHEGLMAGLYQVWRLLLLISALAALLTFLSRQDLLAGIYTLLLPLKPFGVPVERFSVRLWLTLHYAETAPPAESLHARWESALRLPQEQAASMQLNVPNFGRQDVIFACFCFALLGSAAWFG